MTKSVKSFNLIVPSCRSLSLCGIVYFAVLTLATPTLDIYGSLPSDMYYLDNVCRGGKYLLQRVNTTAF